MAMTFEERHQRLDPVDHRPLLRRGEQSEQTALVDDLRPCAVAPRQLVENPAHSSRLRLRLLDQLGHQSEEVLPHPGDALELGPVGHLVQGDPEPELLGAELVGPLQLQEIGPDIGDDITVLTGGEDELVLAEDPSGYDPQDRRHLGLHHPTCDGSHAPGAASRLLYPLLELSGEWLHEMGEARHVALDPLRPTDHRGRRLPRKGEPGRLRHQMGDLVGDARHVRGQGPAVIGVVEGVGPGDAPGEASRAGPFQSHSLTIR